MHSWSHIRIEVIVIRLLKANSYSPLIEGVKMTKRKILILDCTPNDEPSEGRLLKEFFKICQLHKPAKASSLYYKINSKKDFLNKLDTGKRYDIIHISAHGAPGNEIGLGNGSTWWAKPKEIEDTNHNATLVFANACMANKRAIAEAFKGAKATQAQH
jgi:hypothetical protein